MTTKAPQTQMDDPLALDRQVCFALAVANRAVLSVYRPLLEPMGLTHPQYLVMLALWGKSPMAVKEIGRHCNSIRRRCRRSSSDSRRPADHANP